MPDLTGRFDLADEAYTLASQEVHRIDVSSRITIRREPHEAQQRHGLATDDSLTEHRLVGRDS